MTKLEKFKKNLIKNDYTKYGAGIVYKEIYQKCIKDEKGKKYFIDFKQKAVPKEYDEGCFFGLDCQLTANIGDKKMVIDVRSASWFNTEEKKYEDEFFPDLKEIEKFIENIWQSIGANYYEDFKN